MIGISSGELQEVKVTLNMTDTTELLNQSGVVQTDAMKHFFFPFKVNFCRGLQNTFIFNVAIINSFCKLNFMPYNKHF